MDLRALAGIVASVCIAVIVVSAIVVNGLGFHAISLAVLAPTLAALTDIAVNIYTHNNVKGSIHETNDRVERIDRAINESDSIPHRSTIDQQEEDTK
jgi:hypothetical protein